MGTLKWLNSKLKDEEINHLDIEKTEKDRHWPILFDLYNPGDFTL